MKYGVLGKNLVHSYSPHIHHLLGNEGYTFFEREPDQLQKLFNDPDIGGLNVTIPYKVRALEVCTICDETAERIGCVNTMVRKNGDWHGYNTDYDGFNYTVKHANIDVTRKQCLILGDGASSQTVHIALEDLGASEIIHISRNAYPYYKNIKDFYDTADIIINTTPVGMYPNCPDLLIDLTNFKHLSGIIDLIYNPHRTNLLIQAERLHIPHCDGLPFLITQAVISANHFMEENFGNSHIIDILHTIREESENIILVGMPGVGKTTVGKELARVTGRPFYDIDTELTAEIGIISEFIEKHGEKEFRAAESAMIERLGKERGIIISTGGGCVTIAENFAPLRQNGRIYQITQPVENLSTEGRPLSKGGIDRLIELEKVRTSMYQAFAQSIIDHHQDAPNTVARILEDFNSHLSK